MVGHDDDPGLFQSVTQFLKQRPKLRRLDLGNCPWDLLHSVLPDLVGLRVLRVRIASLNSLAVSAIVKCLPSAMVAIHLSTAVSDKPMVFSSCLCNKLLSDAYTRNRMITPPCFAVFTPCLFFTCTISLFAAPNPIYCPRKISRYKLICGRPVSSMLLRQIRRWTLLGGMASTMSWCEAGTLEKRLR